MATSAIDPLKDPELMENLTTTNGATQGVLRSGDCDETSATEKQTSNSPKKRIVILGGGFAGLYVAMELEKTVDMLRVVLVHHGAVILPELGKKLGAYAQKTLAERGVEIRVNTKAKAVSEHGVQLSDGTAIMSNTLVWTAGTSPNPSVQQLPCKKEGGRVVVNQFMEVVGWPGVWALGDCAAVPDPSTGKVVSFYLLKQDVARVSHFWKKAVAGASATAQVRTVDSVPDEITSQRS